MTDKVLARPAEQALAVPVEPASSLAPAGFDPSRVALLWASQGEYSDRSEWPVAIYENEDLASFDAVLGEALHRELFGRGYIPWSERTAIWETNAGQELMAIVGQRCGENDDLHLYASKIEFRTASAIEARRAETETGSVHESAVTEGQTP